MVLLQPQNHLKTGESLPSLEKKVSQPLTRAQFRVSEVLGSFSYFLFHSFSYFISSLTGVKNSIPGPWFPFWKMHRRFCSHEKDGMKI